MLNAQFAGNLDTHSRIVRLGRLYDLMCCVSNVEEWDMYHVYVQPRWLLRASHHNAEEGVKEEEVVVEAEDVERLGRSMMWTTKQ